MPAVEKKKPVKKEEEIDNDEKISTLGNKKKRLSIDNAKTRVTDNNKNSTVAKVEPKDENIEDDEYVEETKDSIKKIVTKTTEEKRRKKSTTVVTDEKKKKRNVVKTVKKVYDLPGQKRDPPEERDPLRIFYESLYEQRPDSEMAALWMMECGLLPVDEAKKVFEQKNKNQAQRKIIMSSPIKAIKAASVTKSANSTVKRITNTTTSTKTTTTTTSSSAKKKPVPEPKTTPKQSASKKRKVGDRSSDGDDSDFETLSNRMTKKRIK
ncbi:hypothetical protein MKW98_000384 [Papaver atlanticum]|uniref:Uncharacterized protein n=1 Tax=Papaver atlanticum TaxID=357466 RepID=A0AAD4X8L4_9MAGN|nr:hypothetical protein MKW98_000384 [Papaver atlanticum]